MKGLLFFSSIACLSSISWASNASKEDILAKCPYELYATTATGPSGPSELLALDPETGEGTTIATIDDGAGAHRVTAIDFHHNGKLYGVGADGSGTSSLMRINCKTGFAYIIGPTGLGAGQNVTDIAFNEDGTLWAYVETGSNFQSDEVGTIDIETGSYASVGSTGINDIGNGLGFDSDGTLYHIGKQNLSIIDQTTGAGFAVSALDFDPPADANPRVHALDLRLTTDELYGNLNDKASNTAPPENYLTTIDTETGEVNFLDTPPDNAPSNLAGIAFNPKFRGCLP